MRIQGIQNFAQNAIDKCCKPRKSLENNSQNNLERTPAMDTVSFGVYDKANKDFVSSCAVYKLIGHDRFLRLTEALEDSIYLRVFPTKDTLLDPMRGKCRLELVSFREMRPDAPKRMVDEYDETMRDRMKDFNEMNHLEDGWEKELSTKEDFVNAAELAIYLDDHGLFPKDDDHYVRPFLPYGIDM